MITVEVSMRGVSRRSLLGYAAGALVLGMAAVPAGLGLASGPAITVYKDAG
jgi:hypothetical protein